MKYLIPALLFLSACQQSQVNRETANLFDLPPTELGEVWLPKHEDQARDILAHTRDIVNARSAETGVLKRDAHPKAHGCVRASFQVDNSALAPGQRVGVFAQNQRYAAWVRFSNGDPDGDKKPDSEKDVRGMAVKLMNVKDAASGSQDFLMINSKEFFSKDGDDYLALFNALTGGTARLALYALTHPISAKRLLGARVQIANPVETSYFSSVPYKLGNRSMRFKAEPCVAALARFLVIRAKTICVRPCWRPFQKNLSAIISMSSRTSIRSKTRWKTRARFGTSANHLISRWEPLPSISKMIS